MPTQNDVAKEAGVSGASVSRYINNDQSLKSSTRERIRKAIDKLGYSPNLVARSLKVNKTFTIALMFSDILDPFFTIIANKAEELAHEHGFSVILCNIGYNPVKEMQYLQMLRNRNVDGYLVLTTFLEKNELYTILKDRNVVFVDQSSGFQNEVFVKLNNKEGMRLGIEYLAQKGHKNIGSINFMLTSTTGTERFDGFKEALNKYDLPYRPEYVKFCKTPDWLAESYNKTKELLLMKDRPTALFPMNGNSTIGALRAIKNLGLKIPYDISVLGFDEIYLSDLLSPPLTTIAQPVEKFGKIGMQLLIDMIKGILPKKRKIVELQPQLIERNSCLQLVSK